MPKPEPIASSFTRWDRIAPQVSGAGFPPLPRLTSTSKPAHPDAPVNLKKKQRIPP